jgi:hypothetical protein
MLWIDIAPMLRGSNRMQADNAGKRTGRERRLSNSSRKLSDLSVRQHVPLNRYVFQRAFSLGLSNANVFFSSGGLRLVLTNKSPPVLFLVGIVRANLSARECDPSMPLPLIGAFLLIRCVWCVRPMCGDDIS